MLISAWSSDVCSSDLQRSTRVQHHKSVSCNPIIFGEETANDNESVIKDFRIISITVLQYTGLKSRIQCTVLIQHGNTYSGRTVKGLEFAGDHILFKVLVIGSRMNIIIGTRTCFEIFINSAVFVQAGNIADRLPVKSAKITTYQHLSRQCAFLMHIGFDIDRKSTRLNSSH